MDEWIVISIAILGILITIGILMTALLIKKKKEGTYKEPNYYAFYIMGIGFSTVGFISVIVSVILDYSFFIPSPIFMIGIVYLAIGLTHKDTWKKNTD